jgi:hypothetical protein
MLLFFFSNISTRFYLLLLTTNATDIFLIINNVKKSKLGNDKENSFTIVCGNLAKTY